MCVHVSSNLPRMEGVANRWTRARMDRKIETVGHVCTIRDVEPAVIAVVSSTRTSRAEEIPESIEEVLQEWGCT